MNPLRRELAVFLNIFTRPNLTARSVIKQGHWLIPLLILTLFTYLEGTLNRELITRDTMDAMSQLNLMTTDQFDEMTQNMNEPLTLYDRTIALFMSLFSTTVNRGGMVLLLMFVTNIVLARSVTFRPLFTISCYGGYIAVLGHLLRIPLARMLDTSQIGVGFGIFLTHSDSFVGRFLMQLDFIVIWEMIFFGAALAVLTQSDRFRSTTSLIGLSLVWVIFTSFMRSQAGF